MNCAVLSRRGNSALNQVAVIYSKISISERIKNISQHCRLVVQQAYPRTVGCTFIDISNKKKFTSTLRQINICRESIQIMDHSAAVLSPVFTFNKTFTSRHRLIKKGFKNIIILFIDKFLHHTNKIAETSRSTRKQCMVITVQTIITVVFFIYDYIENINL